MDNTHLVLLFIAVGVVAFLYSSVGHAGASGYIALMALWGLAPSTIRPTALVLNILVATIGSFQFWRAGHFNWKLFWPFALLSVPMAYLGGSVSPTAADARSKVLYGAHYITGRIIDLPLKGDYGEAESKAAGPVPENTGLAGLSRLGYAGSLFLGSWVPDVMAHGGGREAALPSTAAEREEWGKQGQAQIVAIVKQMRLREAMDDLKKHDQYTNQVPCRNSAR